MSHTQHRPQLRTSDGIYWSSDEDTFRLVLEKRLGVGVPSPARFLAASLDGEEWCICGVANYTGDDCELFFASTGAGTPIRALTRKVAEYCFNISGCRRITTRVEATNKLATRLNKAFGMQHEGTLRQASPDGNDVLIFGILKEEYRYG